MDNYEDNLLSTQRASVAQEVEINGNTGDFNYIVQVEIFDENGEIGATSNNAQITVKYELDDEIKTVQRLGPYKGYFQLNDPKDRAEIYEGIKADKFIFTPFHLPGGWTFSANVAIEES